MEVRRRGRLKAKGREFESYFEIETLNSMIPIWRKNKSELSDEDYNYFYKEKFFDFENPLRVIHSKTEGKVSYNALMFVPAAPRTTTTAKSMKRVCSSIPTGC